MATVITQKSKVRNWREGLFLGEQFLVGEKRFGDKRCDYCGEWFHWRAQDRERYIAAQNWKQKVVNRSCVVRINGRLFKQTTPEVINGEPIHCGASGCQDYHNRVLTGPNAPAIERQDKMVRLFKYLKKKKLVL